MKLIFSYGSNMLFDRIRQRIDSVEVVSSCELQDFELVFNKRSVDGSSKANLIRKTGSSVHGIIHRMSPADKLILDKYEGLGRGYEMESFEAHIGDTLTPVEFYMVKDDQFLCDDLPYHWYLQCVLYGAMENNLLDKHIRHIRNVSFKVDQDIRRNALYDEMLYEHRLRLGVDLSVMDRR